VISFGGGASAAGDAQDGGCSSDLEGKEGEPCDFEATAANPILAQRLRAVASTPISEELADRVRRAN